MFLDIEKKQGDKIALIDSDGRRVTYGEITEFIQKFGRAINSRTLIFIRCKNCIGSVVGFLAAINNRVVPLLISDSIDESLFLHLVDLYHPEYIWKPNNGETKGNELLSEYEYSLVCTKYKAPVLYEDLSLLLSTSGSTGSPKLVRHSYRNLEAQSRNISKFFGIVEDDIAMADLPMNYTMGLSVIISFLYAGASVLLTDLTVLDAEYWEVFESNNVTVLTNIPYTFEILSKLRFFDMDFPSLRIISQGGGKLRESLFIQCAEYAKKNGKMFVATYGQTEGTARMAYVPPEYAETKTCSIGKAIPEGKLYIIDINGNQINEPGIEGELVYEGPNVTLGYAKTPNDLSLGDERKGVLLTGDIAKMDGDGFFYIVGRMTRFIKLNGVRVSLDECENLIKKQFNKACACIGDDSGMKLIVEGDCNSNQILEYISSITGLNKAFFETRMVENLPTNKAGKILYKELETSYGN